MKIGKTYEGICTMMVKIDIILVLAAANLFILI